MCLYTCVWHACILYSTYQLKKTIARNSNSPDAWSDWNSLSKHLRTVEFLMAADDAVRVRMLTVNMCCLAPGLRNAFLPVQVFGAGCLVAGVVCLVLTQLLSSLLSAWGLGYVHTSVVAFVLFLPCWLV